MGIVVRGCRGQTNRLLLRRLPPVAKKLPEGMDAGALLNLEVDGIQ